MQVTEQDLRERYENLETEQLLELQAQGTLTDTASRVLEQVLAERSLSTEDRAAMVAEINRQVAERNELLASLASPSERLGAQFIDSAVAVMIFILSMLLMPTLTPLGATGVLLSIAYLLLADGLPHGQSIGKRALNIAAIHERTRQPCTYWQSFVRNFLLGFLGIFDWIFIFGQMHQRLGDKVASTIVVRLKPSAALAPRGIDNP